MKLALAGLFLCLAVMCGGMLQSRHSVYFAIGAGGFAVASIACSTSVLKSYKGEKRQ